MKKLLKLFKKQEQEKEYNSHIHGLNENFNIEIAATEELNKFFQNKGLYLHEETLEEINKLFPSKAHVNDAGYDLKAFVGEQNDQGEYATSIKPGETKLIKTGFRWAIPKGYVGQVCSRSGLASKYGVFVLNAPGIVDSGYHGDVGVILHNAGKNEIQIAHGDKIAQMVVLKLASELSPHHVFDLVIDSARGTNGFGSTGR